MKVQVFKTSVHSAEEVRQLTAPLDALAGRGHWNFDLDDCDRILRVVSVSISPQAVIATVEDFGFDCAELGDMVPDALAIENLLV